MSDHGYKIKAAQAGQLEREIFHELQARRRSCSECEEDRWNPFAHLIPRTDEAYLEVECMGCSYRMPAGQVAKLAD